MDLELVLEAANPNAKVLVQYANSFSDAALGKSIANQMNKMELI